MDEEDIKQLREQVDLAFAESFATQMLLVEIVRSLQTYGHIPPAVFEHAFDEALERLVHASSFPDKTGLRPGQAMRIIEDLRKIVRPGHEGPKKMV